MNHLDLKELINSIGYTYKNEKLLAQALTHTSYANELRINKLGSYERLEFLGDAVLEMVSSEFFFHNYPDEPEGRLTTMRASAVCEQALAITARDLDLGTYIRFGKGEENSGGRYRESILSDVVEAIIGSIYLDSGIEEAKKFILRFVLNDLDKKQLFYDAKTKLQEYLVAEGGAGPEYRLISEQGPEHDKSFTVQVLAEEKVIGEGTGHSKKAAQQEAAKKALEAFLQ